MATKKMASHRSCAGVWRAGWRWSAAFGAWLAAPAAAQEAQPDEGADEQTVEQPADPFGGLGDELLLFQDLPIVVSGSRTAQPISLSSVPVSLITAADIRYSGLTTIPEMLMFAPGVDVLRLDRNRYAIGVRGMHHEFADRSLFLVNGMDATNPFYGGADFFRLPLFPADIERIEIVRGPGGAAWGANAFNGVVNVLTKSPEDTAGFAASTRVNHFGDTFTHVRVGVSRDQGAFRLSAGYEGRKSSEDAIDDDDFVSDDFGRRYMLDGVGVYRLDADTKLTFGVGFLTATRGAEEFLGDMPEDDAEIYSVRPHLRLDHEFDADTSLYVRWFANVDGDKRPGLWDFSSVENDVEVQVNFKPAESHTMSAGGNVRWVYIDADVPPTGHLTSAGTHNEQWAGLFVIDRWEATERVTVEGQLRGDWYSATEADWAGRLTLLLALDEEKRHIVRVAGAKAFRTPAAAVRNAATEAMPVAPGIFGINLLRPDEIDNEQVYSFEVGYNGSWENGLSASVVGYYQRYDDLIGVRTLPDPTGFGLGFFQLGNVDGADGYGVESELALTGEHGRVGVWHAFNELEPDQGRFQSIRAFHPAEHKVGASARWFIDETWTFNTIYRYSSPTDSDDSSLPTVPEMHRLDLTLTANVFDGRGEVTFGVTDVLDDTSVAIAQIGMIGPSHRTPGRTFFAEFRLHF